MVVSKVQFSNVASKQYNKWHCGKDKQTVPFGKLSEWVSVITFPHIRSKVNIAVVKIQVSRYAASCFESDALLITINLFLGGYH